jgi:nicotinate-nucleotide adenylyltransferase
MVALATLDSAALMASTIELEAPTRPYTIETLERLQAEWPETQWFFLMGADSFAEVTSWREYERLLEEHQIIVALRPGHLSGAALTAHLPPQLQARVVDLGGGRCPEEEMLATPHIYLTDYLVADVSATEIREAVSRGRPIDHLVPRAVASYIAKYNLYRNDE